MNRLPPGAFYEMAIHKQVISPRERRADGTYEFSGIVYQPEELTTAEDVLRGLAAARAAGAKVVLVTMHDCEGGDGRESTVIYEALRDFSRAGGYVIAHVSGLCGSNATTFALAADIILMEQDARYLIHSVDAHGPAARCARLKERGNAQFFIIYKARSWLPEEAIKEGLAKEYDPEKKVFNCAALPAPQALQFGWADQLGDLRAARQAAGIIAEGHHPSSVRTRWLAQQPPEPRWVLDDEFITQVDPGAVYTGQLTAGQINVSNLSAITSNLGTVNGANYSEDANGNPTNGVKIYDNPGWSQPDIKVANGIRINKRTLDGSSIVVANGYVRTQPGSIIAGSGSGMNCASIARVDRGASAYPRYVIRITFADQSITYGSDHVVPTHWNSAVAYQAMPIVCSDTTSIAQLDIGWQYNGNWLDPTGAGVYCGCNFFRFGS